MLPPFPYYSVHLSRWICACIVLVSLVFWANLATAKVVAVEGSGGAGFLVRQGGNCYVVLPTHLHGSRNDGIRLGTDQDGGPIGTARIVYVAPDDTDISVGLVRGGMAGNCGAAWSTIARLQMGDALTPGTELMLRRPRQSMFEGRRLQVHSSGQDKVILVPLPGEQADLFGGTSGAVVYRGTDPIAMVLEGETGEQAFALRMDVVADVVSAFFDIGGKGTLVSTPLELDEQIGDPLEAVSWSAHPVDGSADPVSLLSGAGPWIFDLEEAPVELVLRLTDTDRLSQVTLRAQTGTAHGIPRQISIVTDTSRDQNRPRPSAIMTPEMTPNGLMELQIGERFAHTVTIKFHSSWGDAGTARIDSLVID